MPDTPYRPSPRDSASKRLEGWKEISAHFGKGVRTVQRWEAELDMPVHRMVMAKGETVYALVGELEAWRRRLEPRAAPREAAAAGPEGPGAGPGFAEPTDGGGRASHGEGTTAPAIATPRRVGWITGAGVAIMVLVAIGWVARNAFSTHPAADSGAALAQPARAQVEGNALVAYDSAGRRLWRYPFGFRLTARAYQEAIRGKQDPVVIDDIDGDGNDEVLFVAEPSMRGPDGALFCFDRTGAVRFTYRPQYRVTFGPLKCVPPWRPSFVRVFGDPGRPHRIWLVSLQLDEYPTVVDELDRDGKVLGHYWSNGQVTTLDEAAIGGHRVALVGGTNNETHGASLAILDLQSPTVTAPAESDHYTCPDCPPGPPLAFLVFPPLDATVAIGNYSTVQSAAVDDDGQIALVLRHATGAVIPDAESLDESESLYVIDRNFRVVKAELGQGYAAVHRLFEEKGYLKHPFGSAADANLLWPVRRWNPGTNRFDLVTGVETGR